MTQLPFEKLKRDIIVKRKSKTDPKFGSAPIERSVDNLITYGIINLNKPKGPTSHQASAYVQKILKINKSGHSGTLDPKVTGVLPVALGRGTRIVQALLKAGKEYICIMHLHKEVKEEDLKNAIESFRGEIRQTPPLRSSVKRQERTRSIYYFDIIEIDGPDILFRVGCEAGTYIRKLCHDLGQKLGVGAHMAELIRTKAGPFDASNMFTLQDLADAFWFYKEEKNEKFIRKVIRPVEDATAHLAKVWVLDSTVGTLCHGADLKIPGISMINSRIEEGGIVAMMTLKQELVALGIAKMTSRQIEKSDKGIAVKTDKVFMEPGTYPKISKVA
jgi:H/ACA ribonucleoprotein complex subunit 4